MGAGGRAEAGAVAEDKGEDDVVVVGAPLLRGDGVVDARGVAAHGATKPVVPRFDGSRPCVSRARADRSTS